MHGTEVVQTLPEMYHFLPLSSTTTDQDPGIFLIRGGLPWRWTQANEILAKHVRVILEESLLCDKLRRDLDGQE